MSLEDEIARVRARQQAAADQAASMGSTREGVFMAGLRASLDVAIEALPRDLAQLEEALGAELDGGSFLMGMMGAAFVIQGVDLIRAVGLVPELFDEYIERARQR